MKKYLLLFAAFFFSNSVYAASIYEFDPNHTNITWSANHFGFSNPSGKFTESSGFMIIDEANPQNSSVQITIKTASVQSGFTAFDERLKTKDFLNVEKFPEAKFVSRNVIVQGRTAKVTGDFTLLGVTQTITLNVRLNRIGINSYTQKKTVGFSAKTSFKRSDFFMTFGTPGISDNVKIDIEAEAILSDKQSIEKPAVNSEDVSLIKKNLFDKNAWQIIPKNSAINFATTRDNSPVLGSFKKFNGLISFDSKDISNSAVSIDIDVSSISGSLGDAISILKTSDWFDFAQFPKANFTANSFVKNGNNQFIAKGNLILKGRTVPTDVFFNLGNYTDAGGSVNGYTKIKRSDFGIGNQDARKAGGVQDEVTIKFTINAAKVE
ncbi:MAG: hypothetical protein EBS06_08300 [Proteobacteria bacterium]|nr:hypothetical protein [Pseudomonadota bacterium]